MALMPRCELYLAEFSGERDGSGFCTVTGREPQMRGLASLLVTFVLTLAVVTPACAAEIWYEDNNLGRGGGRPADFVEKFLQPESFKEASGYIDVYLLRASVLQDMDDAFFTELLFPY